MADTIHTSTAPQPVEGLPTRASDRRVVLLSSIGPRDPVTDTIPDNDYFTDGGVRN